MLPAVAVAWGFLRYSARVLVYAARPSTAVHPVVLQLSCALRDLSRCVGVCLGGRGACGRVLVG